MNVASFLGPSPSLSWEKLDSLTLNIPLHHRREVSLEIVETLNHLGRPEKLREVVIELSIPAISNVVHLLHYIQAPIRIKQWEWPDFETPLLQFPQPNIWFSLHYPINFRTRHFWRRHVEKCFPTLAIRGAVTFNAEYCKLFCLSDVVTYTYWQANIVFIFSGKHRA